VGLTYRQTLQNGRLSARLDNNRQVEFNASEHRHFDHSYAVTSHSSQGLTAERVLVHADTSVHPDLLNSRFGYVSISRASTLGEVQSGEEEGGVELWTRGENDSSNRRDSSGKFLRPECRK
jgi:ATP-dependent exoDNAse (exonuclease V) alpha subunit